MSFNAKEYTKEALARFSTPKECDVYSTEREPNRSGTPEECDVRNLFMKCAQIKSIRAQLTWHSYGVRIARGLGAINLSLLRSEEMIFARVSKAYRTLLL